MLPRGSELSVSHWVQTQLPLEAARLRRQLHQHKIWSFPPKPSLAKPAQHKLSKLCERVLQLLRDADKSGKWPDNTLRRSKVIHAPARSGADPAKTVAATKNMAGSFSVGSMPPPLKQPRSNAVFFELTMAAFQLERELVRRFR